MMLSLKTPKDSLLEIAQHMRNRRLTLNMTQMQLSERSNVNIATLRKFERTGKISLESFLKIAFVLDRMNMILDTLSSSETVFTSLDDLQKENKIRKRASRGKH